MKLKPRTGYDINGLKQHAAVKKLKAEGRPHPKMNCPTCGAEIEGCDRVHFKAKITQHLKKRHPRDYDKLLTSGGLKEIIKTVDDMIFL